MTSGARWALRACAVIARGDGIADGGWWSCRCVRGWCDSYLDKVQTPSSLPPTYVSLCKKSVNCTGQSRVQLSWYFLWPTHLAAFRICRIERRRVWERFKSAPGWYLTTRNKLCLLRKERKGIIKRFSRFCGDHNLLTGWNMGAEPKASVANPTNVKAILNIILYYGTTII